MLHALAAAALLVSLADHWTTWICLHAPVAGWQVMEANPLSDWLFRQLGLGGGLLLDSALTLAALAFLVSTQRLPERLKRGFLCLVIGLTGYAVANNLAAIHALGLSLLGGAA